MLHILQFHSLSWIEFQNDRINIMNMRMGFISHQQGSSLSTQ
jgi:hypothetical protein